MAEKMSLEESVTYLQAYATSLKKELKQKDVEIGKLKAYIEELEAQKVLVKGELKEWRKTNFITKLEQEINKQKKDNKSLICRLALKERSNNITMLEAYSKFLEERNYMDSDWRNEEPYAIDEFLKQPK